MVIACTGLCASTRPAATARQCREIFLRHRLSFRVAAVKRRAGMCSRLPCGRASATMQAASFRHSERPRASARAFGTGAILLKRNFRFLVLAGATAELGAISLPADVVNFGTYPVSRTG